MSRLPVRWSLEAPPDTDSAKALAEALGLPLTLASLLCQRGLSNPDQAKVFLRPSLDRLASPTSLAGLAEAVTEIAGAVRAGLPIMVHGDYDVDGQCASAVLTRALRAAGATVHPFVPHRMRDGYDFGPAGLERAIALGCGLIVTCDCGITAVEPVRAARAAGIRVVITDHHLPGPEVPPANAIVDPQRPDDRSGLGALCGTGLVFKLVQALVPALGLPATLPLHFLDYVALATVADVVPLTGENRILTRHGLKLLSRSRWPGIQALVAAAGLGAGEVKAGQVGFILAPRLNAVGRIGDANEGLALLLTDDPDEATRIAVHLEQLNADRQALDQRILEEVLERIETNQLAVGRAGLVLAADGWHPGVVGIVASRVVERYGRPTILIGFDGDIGKGSGRSIAGFDLHAALSACGDLLEKFGGHKMAAGLTIRRDRLAEFEARFDAVAKQTLDPATLGPEQRVHLEIALDQASDDLERLCRHLEPCGMGNPSPVFGVRGVTFANRQIVGQGHLRGWLKDPNGQVATIGFQFADRTTWLDAEPVDAAFKLERNEFRGHSSLQARLLSLSPHRTG